jgi:hypothetical protein
MEREIYQRIRPLQQVFVKIIRFLLILPPQPAAG